MTPLVIAVLAAVVVTLAGAAALELWWRSGS